MLSRRKGYSCEGRGMRKHRGEFPTRKKQLCQKPMVAEADHDWRA